MFLLILISYAFKFYFASARPVPGSTAFRSFGIRADDVVPSTNSPDCVCHETRGIWDIIWSCSATIFACTWVSMHPNVPDMSLGLFGIFYRRAKLMIYAFLVPEVVIVWAIRQWKSANELSRDYKDWVQDSPEEWTKTHGFFLQMGGFVLYKDGKPSYTILPRRFKKLLRRNEIDFPRVTEDDIADRSKGDFLTKGVVLLQTTWFIAQCIARWVQGLGLTELEVLTVALAVLNGITYALWWNKPLDVRWHIRVDWKPGQDNQAKDTKPRPDGEKAYAVQTRVATVVPKGEVVKSSKMSRMLVTPRDIFRGAFRATFRSDFVKNCRRRIRKHGVIFCFMRYLTVYPFQTLVMPIERMISRDKPPKKPWSAPIFYAPADHDIDLVANAGGVVIGSVFGAIHCIAWSFEFPSHIERMLWRVSALAVTAAPVCFGGGLLFIFLHRKITKKAELSQFLVFLVNFMFYSPGIFYFAARMALLVLALISLRALPLSTLAQIDWVTFIPHI